MFIAHEKKSADINNFCCCCCCMYSLWQYRFPTAWWHSPPQLLPPQTLTWGWPCWTPRAKRCPSAGRRCAAASPTPSTRRPSCSRWRSSSCPRCRWCSPCSAAGAAWGPGRGWAGSPWASTAPARSSRPTGLRWKRRRVSRSATGTRSPTHRAERRGSLVFTATLRQHLQCCHFVSKGRWTGCKKSKFWPFRRQDEAKNVFQTPLPTVWSACATTVYRTLTKHSSVS